jgi:hypothetical protein
VHGGGALTVSDFTPAFVLVAALSAMSVVVFWRLEPDAGALVSGRRVADARGPTPQPGE